MESHVRVMVQSYLEKLTKYEIILTAQIFMRLFGETTKLLKYLQTSGVNLLTAQRIVSQTHLSIEKVSRDFDTVKSALDSFVQCSQ